MYTRSTRECPLAQIQPDLLQAVRDYFKDNRPGEPEPIIKASCETVSTRQAGTKLASWLDGSSDTIIHTAMVLTPERLIWTHHGDRSGTRLNWAPLKEIRVGFQVDRRTKEAGMEISGYIGNTGERVRGRIGMGPEPAARNFCEEVRQEIDKIKPPANKGWLGWLKG